MNTISLGQSDLHVTPICLGTMTFGEQVGEQDAHAILDRALERGVNFIDTAEMYAVPAREHGLTPTQLALAFCYTQWRVASTIIGVTSLAQLDEDLDAWGTTLSPELLAAVDAVRWELRDPAL